MKENIKEQLESKGIKVNDNELDEIFEQWQSIAELRKTIIDCPLASTDIGLVNRAGGAKDE